MNKAEIGALIYIQEFTSDIQAEEAILGFVNYLSFAQFSNVRLLTVADLLTDKITDIPPLFQEK